MTCANTCLILRGAVDYNREGRSEVSHPHSVSSRSGTITTEKQHWVNRPLRPVRDPVDVPIAIQIRLELCVACYAASSIPSKFRDASLVPARSHLVNRQWSRAILVPPSLSMQPKPITW